METNEEYEKRQAFEKEVDADVVADFFRWRNARNDRRIWEHLGYERWAIGFARYLFPDFPQVLRRVIWAQLLYEQRYRNQFPASPRPVGKQRQRAQPWSSGVIADFAKLEGLWAICAPPIWDSIRTLGQIYRESAEGTPLNADEKAKYAKETRRRIEHEMEAFGRALVTVKGSPAGRTKGKPKAGRPRKPDASLTTSGMLKRSYREGLRKRTK